MDDEKLDEHPTVFREDVFRADVFREIPKTGRKSWMNVQPFSGRTFSGRNFFSPKTSGIAL